MNQGQPMTMVFRPKRVFGSSNEDEQPDRKKQRLEKTPQISNFADNKSLVQGVRLLHEVDGEKIPANTLCWTVFKNSPSEHLLACGHTIATIVLVPCGTNCKLPPGEVVKAEGPAIECMQQRCQNVIKGIQLRETRRKNVSIFMPRRKRDSLQRYCKPEANAPNASYEDTLVVTNEGYEQPALKRARLHAQLAIDGTEKLKAGRPVPRAANNPFFALPDRELHAGEEKGDQIDPFHASFPEPAAEHEESSFGLEAGPVANKTRLLVDTDGFVCDGCHLPVFDFAHHCTSCIDHDLCNDCWLKGKWDEQDHEFAVIIVDDAARQSKALNSVKAKEAEDVAVRGSAEIEEPKMPVTSLADLRKVTRKVAETKKISLAMYGTRQQVKKRLEEARTRGDHERFTRDFGTANLQPANVHQGAASSSPVPKATLRRKAGFGDLASVSKRHGKKVVKEADEDVKMTGAE